MEQFKQQKLELVMEHRGDAGMDENPHVKSLMNDHEHLDMTVNQPVPEGRNAGASQENPSRGMEGRRWSNGK